MVARPSVQVGRASVQVGRASVQVGRASVPAILFPPFLKGDLGGLLVPSYFD